MKPHQYLVFLKHQWPAFARASRSTAAALIALTLAMSLHLECPYWALMTAIIVIQPTRGLLMEKSFYRLLGTAIGSGAGFLFLLHTASPLELTIAMTVWVAGCVGIGNLLYGLGSYACMMAGFTCVIIAMSGFQHEPQLYSLAFGRVANVVVGILAATAVTAFFTPSRSKNELFLRLSRVSEKTVTGLALLVRHGRVSQVACLEQEILIEIAEVENLLDVAEAGLLPLSKQKQRIRSLISSLLSLLAAGRLAAESFARHNPPVDRHTYWRHQFAMRMEEVARRLVAPVKTVNCLSEMTAVAAEVNTTLPIQGEALNDIVAALQELLINLDCMTNFPGTPPTKGLIRHRDWREACRAACRAAMAIGSAGVVWVTSGWSHGPAMLMTIAIMVSIFSSKEHPVEFMRQVFIGASIGASIAVLCKIFLLPGVEGAVMEIAVLAPFLLIGLFAMSGQRPIMAATDATLFFIFLSQPGVATAVIPQNLMLDALAMVLGVGFTWVAYRYLIPISPDIRMHSLRSATARDVVLLAQETAPATLARLQLRIQHRIIRWVSMATRYHKDPLTLVDSGLAALAICRCIQRLQVVLERENLSPESTRMIRDISSALLHLIKNPSDPLQHMEEATVLNDWVSDPGLDHVVAGMLRDAVSLFIGNTVFRDGGNVRGHI